jgi:transcriptional regulator with XRE-family HTH domain
MRSQKRRTTVIVVGGALAIASVGYGLGTQADDGTAIAENSQDSQQERHLGPGPGFERGAPPGFSDLADRLGVGADKLQQALRDFHDQNDADRRDEFADKLADALGISADKVKSAFEGLHQKREDRFAARLADALGTDADKVKDALESLRDDGPVPFGDFAQKLADELGLDVSDVRAALMEIRPFHGDRHRHRDMPLRQPANALDVSRADLRAALGQLRQSAANGWEQHQKKLAQFLAERFDLDVDEVSDALAATAPPLRSPHRPGLPDHPPAFR